MVIRGMDSPCCCYRTLTLGNPETTPCPQQGCGRLPARAGEIRQFLSVLRCGSHRSVSGITKIRGRSPISYTATQHAKVMIMYKWFAAIVIIYLLGDPQLDYVSWIGLVGEMKEQIMAGILTLLIAPWVVSQFDS